MIREILTCCREPNNIRDSEAVVVAVAVNGDHSSGILGHVPLYLSKCFTLFKEKHKATTEVTSKKVNRGAGLGLEVPFRYKFSGDTFPLNG